MTDTRTYEYDRIADIKRLQYIEKRLKNAVPSGADILDVGCGNGVISRFLGSLGYNVLGVDVDEPSIKKATAKNNLPNVRFEVKSAEQLMAEGKKYDAVICSEVLEHLNQPGDLLKTLHSSLKDNGILVVTVPNGKGPREMFVTRPVIKLRNNNGVLWKATRGVKRMLGYSGATTQSDAGNLDHIQFFTKRSLEELAEKNSFTIVDFANSNFMEDVFPFSVVTRRVKWLQKLDCQLADKLPYRFTGGFLTIWRKADHQTT